MKMYDLCVFVPVLYFTLSVAPSHFLIEYILDIRIVEYGATLEDITAYWEKLPLLIRQFLHPAISNEAYNEDDPLPVKIFKRAQRAGNDIETKRMIVFLIVVKAIAFIALLARGIIGVMQAQWVESPARYLLVALLMVPGFFYSLNFGKPLKKISETRQQAEADLNNDNNLSL